MIDATKSAEQKKMLEIELDARPPDVVFKQKTAGGVSSPQLFLDLKTEGVS
jgi:hypothetical protein